MDPTDIGFSFFPKTVEEEYTKTINGMNISIYRNFEYPQHHYDVFIWKEGEDKETRIQVGSKVDMNFILSFHNLILEGNANNRLQ